MIDKAGHTVSVLSLEKNNLYLQRPEIWDDMLSICGIVDNRELEGYYNIKTGFIIQPKFIAAGNFSDNVAIVHGINFVGLINKQANIIFGNNYIAGSIDKIVVEKKEPVFIVRAKNKQECGLIDLRGNWIIKPIFETLYVTNRNGFLFEARDTNTQVYINENFEIIKINNTAN